MKKEDIEPWDWHRILIGMEPYSFLLEVLLRTFIIYFLFLIAIRLLGKRLDGQLTLTEMSVMILFGAIISAPMQMHERGILVGIITLVCTVIIDRGVNWLNVKSARIEKVTQGSSDILVMDGILQLKTLKATGMSKQNLFSALRSRQIFNLGDVKRVYFESSGMINVFKQKESKPGLPIYPSDELDLVRSQSKHTSLLACRSCGNTTVTQNENLPCSNCKHTDWMEAII